MSTHDPDAWWSPVPGGPGPSAPPVPPVPPELVGPRTGASGSPYAPTPAAASLAPHGPGPGPAVTVRPRRGRTWLLVVVGALVLVVGAVLAVRLGVAGTKVLYDSARTVSVAVPRSWYDNTGEPGSDPDAPPVIAASNLWQSQRIEVDRFAVEDGDTLESFHGEGVDRECAGWPCSSRSGPRGLTVAGHPALEQVVTHAADVDGGASSSLTLTVWLDDRAVEVYGLATASGGTAPDPAPLRMVAASLQLL